MTKKELSQLYHLNKEIAEEQKRLQEIRSFATSTNSRVSGLPHIRGISNKTAIAAQIADCEAIIEGKQMAAVAEYNRLLRYITSVDDSFIRLILTLRYIDGCSWKKVAISCGGGNTEDSVRKAHDRFLKLSVLSE